MFLKVPLSIIRSFSLFAQQWCMSYRFLCPSSGIFHCSHSNDIRHTGLLTAVSKPVWHISLLCEQWKTPDDGAVSKPVWHISLLREQWKTPDDGQRNCPKHVEFYSKNKLEKLVHLVSFITRKIGYRNMQGMSGHIACKSICCTRGGSSFRTLALHCYAPSARSPVDWPHEVIEPMFTTRGPARGESTLHCMRGRCVRHCEPECVYVCVSDFTPGSRIRPVLPLSYTKTIKFHSPILLCKLMALQIVQHEQNSFSADYINSLKHSAYYMAEVIEWILSPLWRVGGWE